MKTDYNPKNISQVLAQHQYPTVVMWNRLEGRPRTHNFDMALKAEVRDALWMLTKQWQMGEFKGDDAGSPVFSKIGISHSPLTHYQAEGKTPQSYEQNIPIEVKAEQIKIPFTRQGVEANLDIRLQMGNYWLRMLDKNGLSSLRSAYVQEYKFEMPEKLRSTDYLYAFREVWQKYAAIAGRCMDGYWLYAHIVAGGAASDNISAGADKPTLDTMGTAFRTWFEKMYVQPLEEKNDAWQEDRLEYQFDYSSGTNKGERVLEAKEYYQGSLDWYAFELSEKSAVPTGPEPTLIKDSFIPTHVQFDGMPNTRWWKFEDSKTDLGDIRPATTDISKLLLMEFGLVFANDWFMIPYTLPIGSLATVKGITVRNNFGETFWIASADADGGPNDDWTFFRLGPDAHNSTQFLAPSVMKAGESEPLEEAVLIRDEMSNMVWGIESRVPHLFGTGQKGNEAALRIRKYHEQMVALIVQTSNEANFHLAHLNSLGPLSPALAAIKTSLESIISALQQKDPDVYALSNQLATAKTALEAEGQLREYVAAETTNEYKVAVSYLAMTSVPENWIPFVPVHVKDNTPQDSREVQLQRASMLRIIEGDLAEPSKVKPQTSVLRTGLDELPKPLVYYIHEEEVPRAGVNVQQSFQRTRWVNGEVYLWLGMRKKTGRGEGSSGLAFDHIRII